MLRSLALTPLNIKLGGNNMDIELTTNSQVMVYDLQTNFSSSALALGMKAICQFAVSNNNRIDIDLIIQQGFASNQAGARNLIASGIESGVWDSNGLLTEDGHETAKTGEVLNREIGPFEFGHSTMQPREQFSCMLIV